MYTECLSWTLNVVLYKTEYILNVCPAVFIVLLFSLCTGRYVRLSSSRFVAERGSSRLLDHVDHMDKLHNVPPPADGKDRVRRDPTLTPIPATPKLR